jgi:hypothetical protein
MPGTIEVVDRGRRISFSFEDVLKYHGPGSPGGAAHAAVTGNPFRVDPVLARPERGRALEAFVFRLGYRDRRATLVVREGFVTDEFIDLARTEHRDDDQERRLDALKRDMADRVLAHPASEVYDASESGENPKG